MTPDFTVKLGRILPFLVACAFAASPAQADVKASSDTGFELTKTVTVKASPADTYAALGNPGDWWSSSHTYSGDAANMTLSLNAGGCFCEVIPKDGGTIEHGRVIYAQPGKTLRLSAALGPLQAEAVIGTLTWTIKPGAAGGSEITQTYVVGGHVRSGAIGFAKPVDGVMNEQLTRLKTHLDK